MGARHNPFCSERVRPGALPFLFAQDAGMEGFVARLKAANMRGQIVGTHGSGKSTLLHAAARRLREEGLRVVELRAPAPWMLTGLHGADAGVVDELDSLPASLRVLSLALLRRRCRGLLAATHDSLGLPTLCTMAPDLRTLQAVVTALGEEVPAEELRQAFEQSGGNLRLALFWLYDRWEERARASRETGRTA